VYVRTGVTSDMISEIARGLNTGIQVAAQSIYNKAWVFDWLKKDDRERVVREQNLVERKR
jgi:hypothetical protein